MIDRRGPLRALVRTTLAFPRVKGGGYLATGCGRHASLDASVEATSRLVLFMGGFNDVIEASYGSVFTPKVAPGSPCLASGECIGGTCRYDTDTCPGTCVAFSGVGGSCCGFVDCASGLARLEKGTGRRPARFWARAAVFLLPVADTHLALDLLSDPDMWTPEEAVNLFPAGHANVQVSPTATFVTGLHRGRAQGARGSRRLGASSRAAGAPLRMQARLSPRSSLAVAE